MAAPRKPLTLQLPGPQPDEILDVARRTRRSVAHVVRRLLAAAGAGAAAAPPPPAGPRAPLPLTTDEDDPPDLKKRLEAAAAGRPLDDAVASAWAAGRERFVAWAAREEAAAVAERADDLDRDLADAARPDAAPARLA